MYVKKRIIYKSIPKSRSLSYFLPPVIRRCGDLFVRLPVVSFALLSYGFGGARIPLERRC